MHFSFVDPVLLAGAALVVAHAVRRGGFVPYLTELIAFGVGLAAAFVAFGPMGGFVYARLGVNQGVAEKNAEITKAAFDGPLSALAWPAVLRKLDRVDPSYKH